MHRYVFALCMYLGLMLQAHADEISDCNSSCDFTTQMQQCMRVAKYSETDATRAWAYSKICYAHIRTRVWDNEMRDACARAAEIDSSAENYNRLGASKIARGRNKEAIKALTLAIRTNPALGETYYNRAIAYDLRRSPMLSKRSCLISTSRTGS